MCPSSPVSSPDLPFAEQADNGTRFDVNKTPPAATEALINPRRVNDDIFLFPLISNTFYFNANVSVFLLLTCTYITYIFTQITVLL